MILALCAIGSLGGLDVGPVAGVAGGLKHCRYEIKGDVFTAPWNPSGNGVTVECNGIFESNGERYVYYRARPHLVSAYIPEARRFFYNLLMHTPAPPPPSMPFRADRAVNTYGDDKLASTREGVVLHPDPYRCWADEIGCVVTDADKTGSPVSKPITAV